MLKVLDCEYLMLSSLAYCYFSKKDIGLSLSKLLIEESPDLYNNKKRILLKNNLFKKMNYFDNWSIIEKVYDFLFDNWRIVDIMDRTNNDSSIKKTSGFYAIAFGKYNQQNEIEKIVIAFRGSELFPIKEAFKDFIETDFLIGTAKKPRQFDQGLYFYQSLIKKFDYKKIELTGHSLGGGIAQYVAVMSEDILEDKNYIPKTFTINGVGILSQGFIEIPYFIKYEKDLENNLYLKRLFKKDFPKIKTIIIKYLLTRCPYIKNLNSFRNLPDSIENFNYDISSLELKLITKSIKLVSNSQKYTRKDIEVLIDFLFDKYRLFKYFKTAQNLLKNFLENKKYENVLNYVHSKDFTASFFPHVGKTFQVDKKLELRDNTINTDIFKQLNRLSIIIEKYHMLDVFVPFIATIGGRNYKQESERGNFTTEINEEYISSALRKLIFLEKNVEKRLLIYYHSSKRNLRTREIDFIRKTFLKILKISTVKHIKYSEIIYEKLTDCNDETIKRIWFACLDKSVSPYKCLDINDIMVYHYV